MISWVMLVWVDKLISFLPGQINSVVSAIAFQLFTLIIPLLYAILGIKKFMNIRWYWSILAGLGVMIAVLLSNLFYRFIVFILTFWVT